MSKKSKGHKGKSPHVSNSATGSTGPAKNEHRLEFEGKVTEKLPNNTYWVEVTKDHKVLAYVSGKMKMHSITIAVGDKVRVELTPYELTRGRIVFRSK